MSGKIIKKQKFNNSSTWITTDNTKTLKKGDYISISINTLNEKISYNNGEKFIVINVGKKSIHIKYLLNYKKKYGEKFISANWVKIKRENKGERGEYNIVKYLFNNKDNKEIIKKIFNIDSRIILKDPKTKQEIISLKEHYKAGTGCKADIIIHFIDEDIIHYTSIKCNDGSPPTLLNHTNRASDYFQNVLPCEQLKILDSIIIKRNNMNKQDIDYNSIKNLLTIEEIDCLINVISYFTFDGTGCSKSKCPADSILIIDNSNNILSGYNFKVCKEYIQKKEYIRSILPELRICMRGGKHGLPGKTNYNKDMILCEPWLFYDTKNKPCVAIHIRYN